MTVTAVTAATVAAATVADPVTKGVEARKSVAAARAAERSDVSRCGITVSPSNISVCDEDRGGSGGRALLDGLRLATLW
jgi:hypothetical protein